MTDNEIDEFSIYFYARSSDGVWFIGEVVEEDEENNLLTLQSTRALAQGPVKDGVPTLALVPFDPVDPYGLLEVHGSMIGAVPVAISPVLIAEYISSAHEPKEEEKPEYKH